MKVVDSTKTKLWKIKVHWNYWFPPSYVGKYSNFESVDNLLKKKTKRKYRVILITS